MWMANNTHLILWVLGLVLATGCIPPPGSTAGLPLIQPATALPAPTPAASPASAPASAPAPAPAPAPATTPTVPLVSFSALPYPYPQFASLVGAPFSLVPSHS